MGTDHGRVHRAAPASAAFSIAGRGTDHGPLLWPMARLILPLRSTQIHGVGPCLGDRQDAVCRKVSLLFTTAGGYESLLTANDSIISQRRRPRRAQGHTRAIKHPTKRLRGVAQDTGIGCTRDAARDTDAMDALNYHRTVVAEHTLTRIAKCMRCHWP